MEVVHRLYASTRCRWAASLPALAPHPSCLPSARHSLRRQVPVARHLVLLYRRRLHLLALAGSAPYGPWLPMPGSPSGGCSVPMAWASRPGLFSSGLEEEAGPGMDDCGFLWSSQSRHRYLCGREETSRLLGPGSRTLSLWRGPRPAWPSLAQVCSIMGKFRNWKV